MNCDYVQYGKEDARGRKRYVCQRCRLPTGWIRKANPKIGCECAGTPRLARLGSSAAALLARIGITQERWLFGINWIRARFGLPPLVDCGCPWRRLWIDVLGTRCYLWLTGKLDCRLTVWHDRSRPGRWQQLRFPDNVAWLTFGWVFRLLLSFL